MFLFWFLLYFVFQVLLPSNCNPSSASMPWTTNLFLRACILWLCILLFLFKGTTLPHVVVHFQKNNTSACGYSFSKKQHFCIFLFISKGTTLPHFVVPFQRNNISALSHFFGSFLKKQHFCTFTFLLFISEWTTLCTFTFLLFISEGTTLLHFCCSFSNE